MRDVFDDHDWKLTFQLDGISSAVLEKEERCGLCEAVIPEGAHCWRLSILFRTSLGDSSVCASTHYCGNHRVKLAKDENSGLCIVVRVEGEKGEQLKRKLKEHEGRTSSPF